MAEQAGPLRRASAQLTWEAVRATLWFWPFVSAVGSLALAFILLALPGGNSSGLARAAWPGDTSAALALLQVAATTTIAATTLTFSLTVVALQLSSQQFSPRLLRQFARDPFTQVVLALLVSTFVLSLTGLRGIHQGEPLPVALLALVSAMGVASIIGLLAFTGHVVRSLRVETMMVAVHQETVSVMEQMYPAREDNRDTPTAIGSRPAGSLVLSSRTGFVRLVSREAIMTAAQTLHVVCALLVRPGDHVVQGTPVAQVWTEDGEPAPVPRELRQAFDVGLQLGYERTVEQDLALGFRQLTDIAVKAVSPAINDPTTAAHAVGYCADLFARLQDRRLGPQQHRDESGEVRLVLPGRDLRYYLDLVLVPLRRYGKADPIVLSALLRMLRDTAANCKDDTQRREIEHQLQLIRSEVSEDLLGPDAAAVLAVGDQVLQVLTGDLAAGYADRAGETRSV